MGRLMRILCGLLVIAPGCEGDEATPVYPECVCKTQGCSAQACSFALSIHANCEGHFDYAEFEIDGYLEELILIPGKPSLTPCTRVEPAKKATVSVRGGTWVWQVAHTCNPSTEPVKKLDFECRELATTTTGQTGPGT